MMAFVTNLIRLSLGDTVQDQDQHVEGFLSPREIGVSKLKFASKKSSGTSKTQKRAEDEHARL